MNFIVIHSHRHPPPPYSPPPPPPNPVTWATTAIVHHTSLGFSLVASEPPFKGSEVVHAAADIELYIRGPLPTFCTPSYIPPMCY